jgi:hypothetical protein
MRLQAETEEIVSIKSGQMQRGNQHYDQCASTNCILQQSILCVAENSLDIAYHGYAPWSVVKQLLTFCSHFVRRL